MQKIKPEDRIDASRSAAVLLTDNATRTAFIQQTNLRR